MAKSITWSLNLEVFMLGEVIRRAWLDLLWDRVLTALGPLGSWSFSPVGGNCLHSEGELVYVLSEKRKEDCQNSWWVLAVNLKGNYLLDPCWVSSNPLWGVPLFLGQNLSRGLTVPRTGDSTVVEHQTKVWCARRRRVTLPSKGLGRWVKRPQTHP